MNRHHAIQWCDGLGGHRLKNVVAMCVLCALSTSVYATNLDFHRWQFGEFAATVRYLKYGKATEGINEIYAKEIAGFLNVDDMTIGMLCPEETSGTLSGQWTFFGARFLPLLGERGPPSFYAVTYLGGATGFHNSHSFDALLTPEDMSGSLGQKKCVQEYGLSDRHVRSFGYAHLTHLGHHAPLSFNALDIDGDNEGDFTFGGLLHVSSSHDSPVGDTRLGAQAAFIRTDHGVRLVRLHQNVVSVERYREGVLSDEATVNLQGVAGNAGHSLVVLPGDQDHQDVIGVRVDCGLAAYDYRQNTLRQTRCITGLTGEWALPGARADFDGDGVEDFWLSQTLLGKPDATHASHVRLISGALWRKATGLVHIDQLTIAMIQGSARYSDHDGVATTLSPFAGDIDADGKPDLTFSGHRHLNEAGALYILFGRDLHHGMVTTIENKKIVKIAGGMMSQLAPPYHHWDATDWDGDGHDDIVVSADNDLYSGLNAGAIFVLSGQRITHQSVDRQSLGR